MKTSVKTIMMSFALMGCLIFGASDASAQGRSRSQGGSTTSRSQSAAVSRSNNTTAPTVSRSSSSSSSRSSVAATPQVNRSSSSTNRSTSSATPQVNRSSSSTSRSISSATPQVSRSSSSTSRSTSATPQVSRSTSGMSSDKSSTVARPSSNSSTQVTRPTTSSSSSSGSRPGTGATTRGDSKKGGNDTKGGNSSTVIRHSDNTNVNVTRDNSSAIDHTTTKPSGSIGINSGKPNGGKPNGNGGKPNGGGKPDGNGGKPDNGGKPNGNGGKPDGGGKPNGGGHGHGGNSFGGNNNNHFDYSGHHYGNDFHNNYTHHNWSWSRPLPPPARPYRPAPIVWYRPVIPTGWYPYASAPIIDRILGITFGTLFDTSLDYLYYNGYEIDGYADHIIYLREVPLLGLSWDDAMLCYDTYDRLVNAQFVFMGSSHNRYDRVYRKLCRIYGTPFSNSDGSLSWYGGNNTGWITLSANTNLGYYYTTLSIGY